MGVHPPRLACTRMSSGLVLKNTQAIWHLRPHKHSNTKQPALAAVLQTLCNQAATLCPPSCTPAATHWRHPASAGLFVLPLVATPCSLSCGKRRARGSPRGTHEGSAGAGQGGTGSAHGGGWASRVLRQVREVPGLPCGEGSARAVRIGGGLSALFALLIWVNEERAGHETRSRALQVRCDMRRVPWSSTVLLFAFEVASFLVPTF